jgi:hypothetical protein
VLSSAFSPTSILRTAPPALDGKPLASRLFPLDLDDQLSCGFHRSHPFHFARLSGDSGGAL